MTLYIVPQGANEYHPFTIATAPHEENIGIYVRAVGPWTTNLRRIFDQPYTDVTKVNDTYP